MIARPQSSPLGRVREFKHHEILNKIEEIHTLTRDKLAININISLNPHP